MRTPALIIFIWLFGATGYAQDKKSDKIPVKFGKVTPADFNLSGFTFDSAADAVVIADVGNTTFEGNTKGSLSLRFSHSKRIKILNRKGFEAATISIPLFTSGNATEKIDGLKAVTYNLENGQVVETKLDDKSVFTDKVSRNLVEKKFTFPALKEGSIIEYSYTQWSDFLFNLQPWVFQGQFPCIWSEYEVDMPRFLEYVTLSQGYLPYTINTANTRNTSFRIMLPGNGSERMENLMFEDEINDHRWVMKNVPALKEEKYTTTLRNYVSKIEFQLSRINFKNSIPIDKMGNWPKVSDELLKSEDFGAGLDKNNGWLKEELKTIIDAGDSPLKKARKIYGYIRDNFTATGYGSIYISTSLKDVFKNRHGSAAELNLLLTAMLIHENIQADPVILSTRANGFTHELYPLLSRFNYVISRAIIDSTAIFLDASEPWLGFGRLPARCYNGHARVINREFPSPVYLDADDIREKKTTTVFIANEEGKGAQNGHMQSITGYFESSTIREKIRESGEKEFFKSLQTGYSGNVELSNMSFDSLKILDQPLGINYDFKLKYDTEVGVIYFKPLLSEALTTNPFTAAERSYPVEMPSVMDQIYVINIEIPEGYVLDELPKSAKVSLNSDEGFFEYMIGQQENMIQLRSHIRLEKANFKPEDYNTLREFFGFVVKKQNEQIVFKKKEKI